MRMLRSLLVLALFAMPLAFAHSQVAVGVGVGVDAPVYQAPVVVDDPYAYGPPVCSWGYYPYAPYGCAPYGYYGPSWFIGGIFIGAGPWYGWHGGYYGHYHGAYYRSRRILWP